MGWIHQGQWHRASSGLADTDWNSGGDGGAGNGFEPKGLLAASAASCVIMTYAAMAHARGLDLTDVKINSELSSLPDKRLRLDHALHVALAPGAAFGGLLLFGGRLGDVYGKRLMLRLGMVLSVVASLAAALATNGPLLQYEITSKARGLGPTMKALTAWWMEYGKTVPARSASRGRKSRSS